MRAQNELSPYFAEIEQRTDRALKGIRKVRSSAKIRALPREPKPIVINTALLTSIVFFIALFID
ncbi:MAG: hypothetical protein ABJL55_10800 [Roseibium sp.]